MRPRHLFDTAIKISGREGQEHKIGRAEQADNAAQNRKPEGEDPLNLGDELEIKPFNEN